MLDLLARISNIVKWAWLDELLEWLECHITKGDKKMDEKARLLLANNLKELKLAKELLEDCMRYFAIQEEDDILNETIMYLRGTNMHEEEDELLRKIKAHLNKVGAIFSGRLSGYTCSEEATLLDQIQQFLEKK